MKLLVVVAVSLMMFATALATEPPAFGGYDAGWGQNPMNWDHQEGIYNSGLCLWDPVEGSYVQFDGDGNRIGPITYDPITIELWVEIHMICTYGALNYQFHRVNENAFGGETVEFIIDGTVRSNELNWVGLVPGPDGFDALVFRHGMYGSGADIPLTWYGRYGDGIVVDDNEPWMLMIHNPCGGMGWCIRKCDHWFQFKGVFDLPYHIDDGYYSLEISGCPTPGL